MMPNQHTKQVYLNNNVEETIFCMKKWIILVWYAYNNTYGNEQLQGLLFHGSGRNNSYDAGGGTIVLVSKQKIVNNGTDKQYYFILSSRMTNSIQLKSS